MYASSKKLFKESLFHYLHIEIGAPCLYNYAPFGGTERNFLKRISEIIEEPYSLNEENNIALMQHYIQYCLDIPKLISRTNLPLGTYKVPDINHQIDMIVMNNPEAPEEEIRLKLEVAIDNSFKDDQYLQEITVTQTHLDLLKPLYWRIEYQYNLFCYLEEGRIEKPMLQGLSEIHRHASLDQNKNTRFNIPVPTANPKHPYGGGFPPAFSESVHRELALALQAMAWYGT